MNPAIQRMISGRAAEMLGALGRNEDNATQGGGVAHVADGDLVIPAAVQDAEPALVQAFIKAMTNQGKNWREYMFGHGTQNPRTGMEEFQAGDERRIVSRPNLQAPQGHSIGVSPLTGMESTRGENVGGGHEQQDYQWTVAPVTPAPTTYAFPTGIEIPESLTEITPDMDPLQVRTAIATQGLMGENSAYRQPEAVDLFFNLAQQALFPTPKVSAIRAHAQPEGYAVEGDMLRPYNEVLTPVEIQYLEQVAGIPASTFETTAELFDAMVNYEDPGIF